MLTVIATGKLREACLRQAAAEYEKRLRPFGGVRIIELPEAPLSRNPAPAEIRAALKKEAGAIERKLPGGSWLCVLTPEGRLLSSPQLAETLSRLRTAGRSNPVFLIGSSYGVDEALKRRADFLLSVSPMTFPHQLFRVMLLEQLYRAEGILAGTRYHK